MRVYRYTLALPTDDSGVTSLELPKEAKILTAAINDGEVVLIALVSTNAVAAQLAVTAAANLAAVTAPVVDGDEDEDGDDITTSLSLGTPLVTPKPLAPVETETRFFYVVETGQDFATAIGLNFNCLNYIKTVTRRGQPRLNIFEVGRS